MQLNIKNPKVYAEAVELSKLTGESLTAAVGEAVHQRLEQEKRLRSRVGVAEKLMEIGRRYSALPDKDTRTADEILGYDENGLPT